MAEQGYDLLIVGAGTAGMACAITAAEHGARVAIIEKDHQAGGALHWSGGHMSAGGTRRQKAMGIEDSVEKHRADIQRINEGTGDLTLIRLAVEEAPRTIDWLDDLGFEFAPECPRIIYGHVPYTEARTHYGTDKALSIYKVLLPLWNQYLANGQINLMLNTSLLDLLPQQGRYNRILARKSTGEDMELEAKNLVLTTGGYGSAPAYFKAKHPNIPMVSSAYPMATAEGHQIAEGHGARFRMADLHLPSLGGLEMEPGSGRCNFNEAWAMVLTSIYRQPREIYLNLQGQRFMAEDETNADTRERIVVQQPEWKFWMIFDEAALLERNEEGVENPIIIGWDTEKIKKEARAERAIFSAPTLETLIDKIKLPAATTLASIEAFNQNIATGHDPLFGRKYLKNGIHQGPFYAILVHASLLVTFGGIAVNEKLEVLDTNGEVLPGLYAAGEILGLGATSGKAFSSGMAITPALSFGRILGKHLATMG